MANVLFEGTSITASYWRPSFMGNMPGHTYNSIAVGGSTIANIIGRAATADGYLSPGDLNIMILEGGANNFYSAVQATNEADLESLMVYAAARKAAGWKVIYATQLPQGEATGNPAYARFNTARVYLNPLIRAEVGNRIDACMDWAADPRIGTVAAVDARVYYDDDVHPSYLGGAVMAAVARHPFSMFVSTTTKRLRLVPAP